MSRLLVSICGTGLTLAVLAPALSPAPFADDSFPFSTYPMFARALDKRDIVFAEGVTPGAPRRLGPELVANDEPMQAQRTLRLAARAGRPALRMLCSRIAERVLTRSDLNEVTRVRIERGVFDPVKYFTQDDTPETRDVLTECRVRRHQ